MKRILHGGLVGATLGAAKGILDLSDIRWKDDPNPLNPYVDKVTPPPTYVHAAADQASVGLLGGLAFGAAQAALDESDRQEKRREWFRKRHKWPTNKNPH